MVGQKSRFQSTFLFWPDHLGISKRDMMFNILKTSHGHPLARSLKFVLKHALCQAFSLGKLLTQPSTTKITLDCSKFLQQIQRDICGPI